MKRVPRNLGAMLAPPVALPRRSLRSRPLVVASSSAVAGFVSGAIFWHMIGFWSFVSHVVMKGPDEDAVAQVARIEQMRAANRALPVAMRPTGSITPSRTAGRNQKAHQACSLIMADDRLGEAAVLPCPPGTLAAPAKALAKKGDRLAVAAAAATAAEPGVDVAVVAAPPASVAEVRPAPEPLPDAAVTDAPPTRASAWSTTIRGPLR